MENKILVVCGLFTKTINGKLHFLVALRDEFRPGGLLYEFPGGKKDLVQNEDGTQCYEDDVTALKREMLEELDLNVEVKEKIIKKDYGHLNVTLYNVKHKGEPKLTVHKEFKWVTLEELPSIRPTVIKYKDVIPKIKEFFKEI